MEPQEETEEMKGPSVESADPEERIMARRLRIKKRLEQQRKAAMGEDSLDSKSTKQELSKSRKQMKDSKDRVEKLKKDGSNLVDNIKVAADEREHLRRKENNDNNRSRAERLESEAKTALERFEEITKRWQAADMKEIPQDLHDLLMQQKSACDAMIEEKNKLIKEFQEELKTKDDQYVKDLKKQAEDIDLMVERMEDQIKNLTKTHREELMQVEKAFVSERKELLQNSNNKFDSLMKNKQDKEENYLENRQAKMEDNERVLQELRVKDAEDYNSVKIKMETDVQILEQQVQQMKATYQLNQEKLEYNFQVLKKRDDENTITKNQQKRKITKLQDVLNNLKSKLNDQEKDTKKGNVSLMEEYKKICEQFKDLQKKVKIFQEADFKKFRDLWLMKEEMCHSKAFKLLSADQLIAEQHLGQEYLQPNTSALQNRGPIMKVEKLKTEKTAVEFAREILGAHSAMGASATDVTGEQQDSSVLPPSGPEAEGLSDELAIPNDPATGEIPDVDPVIIQRILTLLTDESGFLMESKLKQLLKPLDDDDQSLMRLDAIFQALGVDTESDINKLASYFIKYNVTPRSESNQDPDEEVARIIEGQNSANQRFDEILIKQNDVVKALRKFIQENRKLQVNQQQSIFKSLQTLEERDDSKDSDYWRQLADIVSVEREKLLTSLVTAEEKYCSILKERSKLISDTDSLRQQNAELRLLLNQYINSKVNQELEVPPTRVLQLDILSK
ncbi:dynein regulatory complex protein 1-like [Convolutriloba macropyga]|uniref:dynein regulatory complex protein 1-like n=1 Tax=Convolutriloba macropyga TaxID=536237 RepID=UPI003F528BE4